MLAGFFKPTSTDFFICCIIDYLVTKMDPDFLTKFPVVLLPNIRLLWRPYPTYQGILAQTEQNCPTVFLIVYSYVDLHKCGMSAAMYPLIGNVFRRHRIEMN